MNEMTLQELLTRYETGLRDFSGSKIINSKDSPVEGLVLDGTDFKNSDLSGVYVNGATFKGADFSGSKLNQTTFFSVDLTGANLTSADMTKAYFAHVNFRLARFTGSILQESVFQNCDLEDADFTSVEATSTFAFRNCRMNGANLSGLHLQECSLFSCDLSGANLRDTDFYKSYLADSVFRGASLRRSRLYRAVLTNANFTGTDLQEADLTRSSVSGSIFVQTNLDDANLEAIDGGKTVWHSSSLRRTILKSSVLPDATFVEVNCSDSTFLNADLLGASFFNVNARNATFTGAALRRGVVAGSDFAGASLSNLSIWLTEVDEETTSTMNLDPFAKEYSGREPKFEDATVLFSIAHDVPTHALVQVFYATDRQPTGDDNPDDIYGTKWSTKLEFGICDVSIPRDHLLGKLEGPSIWRLERSWNPERHIALTRTANKPEADFFVELKDRLGSSKKKQGLLFIHGFNVSFKDAIRRAGQLAYDLSFGGPVMAYSWSSAATVEGYVLDATSAERTVPNLTDFIKKTLANDELEELHVIAHSMGNRALLYALARVVSDTSLVARKIKNIVFTAPDVDAQIFSDSFPTLIPVAQSFTLYASSHDRALNASKLINGYRRAGDAGEDILVLPPLATIDASELDTDLIGHSYYGDNTSVISDLFYLIKNLHPDERHNLRVKFKDGDKYWVFSAASR